MCVAIAEAHLDRVVRLERFGGGDRISGIVNDDRKATFHDPFKRIALEQIANRLQRFDASLIASVTAAAERRPNSSVALEWISNCRWIGTGERRFPACAVRSWIRRSKCDQAVVIAWDSRVNLSVASSTSCFGLRRRAARFSTFWRRRVSPVRTLILNRSLRSSRRCSLLRKRATGSGKPRANPSTRMRCSSSNLPRPLTIRRESSRTCASRSVRTGTAISAAAVGVGARRSAA